MYLKKLVLLSAILEKTYAAICPSHAYVSPSPISRAIQRVRGVVFVKEGHLDFVVYFKRVLGHSLFKTTMNKM